MIEQDRKCNVCKSHHTAIHPVKKFPVWYKDIDSKFGGYLCTICYGKTIRYRRGRFDFELLYKIHKENLLKNG